MRSVLALKELSDGITRQHDQSEYSKDGAYRHVHAIEAGCDQAERVLLSPADAAARVSRHRARVQPNRTMAPPIGQRSGQTSVREPA